MKGKDLLLGLKYIGDDLIAEAETAMPTFQTERKKPRRNFRRPLLIAALVAMMLMLVGCGVVYVLKMEQLKLEDTTGFVHQVDSDTNIAGSTVPVEQKVLTLSGLVGTPSYQAAQEWYEFKQSYDPEYKIFTQLQSEGKIPEYPAAYSSYNIYTQEMKDKVDEIVQKYNLKLAGGIVPYRTTKQLCRALGIQDILVENSDAHMRIKNGWIYEGGNLNLDYEISLPQTADSQRVDTWGQVCYRRKDCFSKDTIEIGEGALIGENYGVREWNYTKSDGTNVLIVRSSSDWRAWLFSDQPQTTVAVMVEARFEAYSDDEQGNILVEATEMTDRQLEVLAENVDFSLVPTIDPAADITGGAVGNGETIDGYTVTLKSATTDEYWGEIVLALAAPEGVVLLEGETSLDFGYYASLALDGVNYYAYDSKAEEDGDGRDNTCNLVIEWEWDEYEPLVPQGQYNLYLEDINRSRYDPETFRSVSDPLVEGTWTFDFQFDYAPAEKLELITQPIQVKANLGYSVGGGGDEVFEVGTFTITSFTLRENGYEIQSDAPPYADFLHLNGNPAKVVLKDGTEIELYGDRDFPPLDLSQVDHVILADGTKLPVPQE